MYANTISNMYLVLIAKILNEQSEMKTYNSHPINSTKLSK